MENLKKELAETEEKQEYERIKALTKDAEKRYKAARYKDTRVYSTNVSIWKKSFIKHLSLRDFDNPERGARMAIDVMLPFKKKVFTSYFCTYFRRKINQRTVGDLQTPPWNDCQIKSEI